MQAILKVCVDIEERVGDIYRELVNHPEANAELKEIWQQMAADEDRHAQRIRSTGDRLQMAGVTDCGLSDEQVRGLLDRAGEILLDVQEGRLSLEQAIYASVELEDEFLKAHLVFADTGGQPDLQTMFKALAEADREHTARLKGYLERMYDGHGLIFKSPGDEK